MPRNGVGTYTLPPSSWNPAVSGGTIESTAANTTLADLASAMTQSLSKDGQTVPTGNIQLGGFKIISLGDGSISTDAMTYGQGAKLTGNNTFTGDQTINGSVSLSGALTVTGPVIFTTGTISLDNLTVSSIASIASLNVTGTTRANILNVASVASVNVLNVASVASINRLTVASVASMAAVYASAVYINGAAISTSTAPYNYIGGCGISRTSGTTITIAAGQAADTTNAATIAVSSTLINLGTTGANGMDVGSTPAANYVAIYAIAKADGTQAGLGSLSFTAPTLPATYTVFRRVGFILTSGSAVLPFIQTGRRFRRNAVQADISGSITSTRANFTLPLPTGKKWPVFITINGTNAGGAVISNGNFCDPDADDQTPAATLHQVGNITAVNGQPINGATPLLVTNTLAQIAGKCDAGTSISFSGALIYWEDDAL